MNGSMNKKMKPISVAIPLGQGHWLVFPRLSEFIESYRSRGALRRSKHQEQSSAIWRTETQQESPDRLHWILTWKALCGGRMGENQMKEPLDILKGKAPLWGPPEDSMDAFSRPLLSTFDIWLKKPNAFQMFWKVACGLQIEF